MFLLPQAETLTDEHSVKSEAECERITSSSGFIINGRVNGVIAVTRSLGDHNMKEWLISDPYFKAVELAAEDSHLILACDGVRAFPRSTFERLTQNDSLINIIWT